MTGSPQEGRTVRNLLLRIAYDGTDFYGWQIQPRRPTIQGGLMAAIEKVCGEQVRIHGAGRTDAGVHAMDQAANVALCSPIPCSGLVRALNRCLPQSIRVLSAREVSSEFHARRDARSKIYRYRIFRGPTCPPCLSRYVYPFDSALDEQAMQVAARRFEGTHDFRSFASSDGSKDGADKTFSRTIFSSAVAAAGEELTYTVEGSGFLHHMVRNIVGTLLWVGRKRVSAEAISRILSARCRSAAGPTAPARGLHLVRVIYSEDLQSPAGQQGTSGRI